MPAVRFTANGPIRWTTLAAPLADVSDGAFTCAVVLKRGVDDANHHGLAYLVSGAGAGTTEAGLSLDNNDILFMDAGGASKPVFTITGTTETYMVVGSKAAGSAPLIYSRYVKSTTTWTHETSATSIADQIDATIIELGAFQQTADLFNGWMAVAAFWEGAMSQANKEALVTNWRTSDLYASAHGTPAFLTELNTLTPVDLIGNATSRSVDADLTLDAGETLASWNFDGTGVAQPAIRTFNPIPFIGRI